MTKMKMVLWLVLVCLITAVLVLSSCIQNVPVAPPKSETEAAPTPPQTPEPEPASFSVSGLTVTPDEVTTGSAVTIEILVTNTGNLSGTCNIVLKIDGTPEATEKVTLEGGTSQKVTFTRTKFTAKTYLVSINGQSGTFVVNAPLPSPVVQPPTPPLPPLDAFMKGFNFADWAPFDLPTPQASPIPKPPPPPADQIPAKTPPPKQGLYAPPQADQSLKNLAATGTNWISLLVVITQETIASTEVTRHQFATASDPALRHMIDLAHSLGMRVMLNPVVMLSQDPTHGHIQIGTAFTTEEQWQAWFASYRQIIIDYATLAQDAGADIFYIGNELASTVQREADWRRIAQEVRQVYKGPIIYEATTIANPTTANPWLSEELQIKWWDAVDYIGVLGYFPLTESNNPTVEELKSAWVKRGYLSRLESLSQKFQRPIIISEIGYQSADGTNTYPANFPRLAQAPVDLQEQADCYQAALEVLWGKPWLKGIFWFQWFVNPNEPGLINDKDKNESPQGKPAEEVVKKFYLSR